MALNLASRAAIALDNAQLYAALREADRRKDEFLATLAHELRNPLAPIRTGLEVLRLADDDAAKRQTAYGVMERQVQQLVALIDDLLDVSRITRGKLELRSQAVELREVVDDAVAASRPVIDERGHTLKVNFPEADIALRADPHRLAQILSNLLNNAAKYTPNGGYIVLEVSREEDGVRMAVQDNGIGIPAEERQRIFEMFAQLGQPLKGGEAGLGIGLTLVKSLIELHGGRIDVHSEGRNRGSTFGVWLPLAPPPKPAAPQADEAPAQPIAGEPRRVLIADDNVGAAEMLALVVEAAGHQVRLAADGAEAVRVADGFRPEIILMDLGMPRMDGYEAARQIRSRPWGSKVELVALSGWGQPEDKRRSREAGFDAHLVKPAEPEAINRLLASGRADVLNPAGSDR